MYAEFEYAKIKPAESENAKCEYAEKKYAESKNAEFEYHGFEKESRSAKFSEAKLESETQYGSTSPVQFTTMRKLILQMQMSLDGFVAGPEGELDWMSPDMDPQQTQLLKELTENIDTILMGRKMTDGFVKHWEDVADNQPDSPDHPYARIFVDTPKIVFSRTVKSIKGKNVTVENGDLEDVVTGLKKLDGRDIIVYGGANFASELIKYSLVDEFYLIINPVAIGKGLKIFNERCKLKLVRSIASGSGVIVNQYEPMV